MEELKMQTRINLYFPVLFVILNITILFHTVRVFGIHNQKHKIHTSSVFDPSCLQTETKWICSGSEIPKGWIQTDSKWSPGSCGSIPGTRYNNMILIERYDNRPVGAEIFICAGQEIPSGWIKAEAYWKPCSCGGTPNTMYNNVIKIRRIN